MKTESPQLSNDNSSGEATGLKNAGAREDSPDALLAAVESRFARCELPEATYRLQFNNRFTFRDARELVPYLAALGISHVYASPYLKARAGSMHGYDIVDHTMLNPEVGSEADYDEFVRELHAHGVGQILDVVPNHMGVASNDNAWWSDVLENGPSSPYASFFDIDWMPLKPDLANKVLLPVLGDQFGKVLEDGQLKLHFEDGAFVLSYYDRRFPIAPQPSVAILKHRLGELEQRLGAENPQFMEYQSILTAISHLPPRTETDPEKINERRREKEVVKRRLNELTNASPEVREFFDDNVRLFNGMPGDPRSFDLLDQLLFDQAYRLAYWRVASDEINYRRFFDINELAAICMENPEVFQKAHSLILRLVSEGKIDGLRIDHPDGLFDPPGYLLQLQQARFLQLCHTVGRDSSPDAGVARDSSPDTSPSDRATIASRSEPAGTGVPAYERVDSSDREREAELLERWTAERAEHPESPLCRPLYLVVEKILGRGERLPEPWAVHGTTGYEFSNTLGGLFVDRAAAKAFDAIYSRFIRQRIEFRDLVYECKKQTMFVSMSSEIEVLAHQLDRISEQNRWWRDFTLNTLRMAIREVIACFPVYRTYITEARVDERDRQYVEQAVARAKRKNRATNASIFDFVRDVLLLQYPKGTTDAACEAQRRFVGKFQQVTGPVMAKGVEDTAFYIYNRLVSLNEVGGEPDKFGTAVTTFHQRNQERQARWPHALLATTTHDTKRSEDVRARINVLSELSSEWRSHLARWSRLNQRRKTEVDGESAPSRNDEYLLYQTLIGTWPFRSVGQLSRAGETSESAQTDPSAALHTLAPAMKGSGALGSGGPIYAERVQQYMLKAAREAKVQTSWISPHEPYERALQSFVAAILADTRKNGFLAGFVPFARRVAEYGIWNSLAQTLLRLTSPGVPDVYQGTELWDLSLVDPDNRRPVDYPLRREMLHALDNRVAAAGDNLVEFARELVSSRTDGRIKLFLISQVLNYRRSSESVGRPSKAVSSSASIGRPGKADLRSRSGLFTTGAYIALEAEGTKKEHVCAFVRKSPQHAVVVVAPRLVVRLTGEAAQPPTGPDVWSDTWLPLPAEVTGAALCNIFTGEVVPATSQSGSRGVFVSEALRSFPVALLEAVE